MSYKLALPYKLALQKFGIKHEIPNVTILLAKSLDFKPAIGELEKYILNKDVSDALNIINVLPEADLDLVKATVMLCAKFFDSDTEKLKQSLEGLLGEGVNKEMVLDIVNGSPSNPPLPQIKIKPKLPKTSASASTASTASTAPSASASSSTASTAPSASTASTAPTAPSASASKLLDKLQNIYVLDGKLNVDKYNPSFLSEVHSKNSKLLVIDIESCRDKMYPVAIPLYQDSTNNQILNYIINVINQMDVLSVGGPFPTKNHKYDVITLNDNERCLYISI